MLLSMTGFGKAVAHLPNKKITVEIRTLNSKGLDLNLRIPSVYREKESIIRQMAAQGIQRGKADLAIYMEWIGVAGSPQINMELVKWYYNELKPVADELGAHSDLLASILRMPEVVKSEREELNEEEWLALEKAIGKAVVHLNEFRAEEGMHLKIEFEKRVGEILKNLEHCLQYEGARVSEIKSRLQAAIDQLEVQPDKNRLEQELIFYFEKLDVTEEKVRLRKHCDYFLETMNEKESQGRKLGFITQEMGREINTLGSKSNHAEMQKAVVSMKDELEKIKEQVLNIL
jgi:uncharacterized protein (TIGR00255 family)